MTAEEEATASGPGPIEVLVVASWFPSVEDPGGWPVRRRPGRSAGCDRRRPGRRSHVRRGSAERRAQVAWPPGLGGPRGDAGRSPGGSAALPGPCLGRRSGAAGGTSVDPRGDDHGRRAGAHGRAPPGRPRSARRPTRRRGRDRVAGRRPRPHRLSGWRGLDRPGRAARLAADRDRALVVRPETRRRARDSRAVRGHDGERPPDRRRERDAGVRVALHVPGARRPRRRHSERRPAGTLPGHAGSRARGR